MKKGLCLLLLLLTVTTSSVAFAADYDGYFLPGESGCDEEVIQNDGYDIIDGYTFYIDDPISENNYSAGNEIQSESTVDGYFLESAESNDDEVFAASGHRHTYTTVTSFIDDNKHSYKKYCTGCGRVSTNSTRNHTAAYQNSQCSASPYNSSKHLLKNYCKVCNHEFNRQVSHISATKYKQEDENVHYQIRYCKQNGCGYELSSKKVKHSGKGVCRLCGYQNTSKVYKGVGECAVYLGNGFNDLWIYKNCPKCGSYSSTDIWEKPIKSNVPAVGGRRVSIYHIKVRCNDCGKEYWNKCFHK